MSNNSSFDNNDSQSPIDIKSYILKVFSYWKLFIITITIGFVIANFLNGYKQKSYSLNTIISVKKENNPLFSTGTNIAFNWGGESNEIGTVKVILNSRTHNEKVVDSLQFYIAYLNEGRYRKEDVYGMTPFKVNLEKDKPQLYERFIKIEALTATRFRLSFDFNASNLNELVSYVSDIDKIGDGATFSTFVSKELSYSKEYSVGEKINTPFLNLSIEPFRALIPGEFYFIQFNSFNETVGRYRGIRVTDLTKGASILKLQLEGTNKYRIVNYLNTSVKVLEKDKRAQKIAYARNTKDYIDDLFDKESDSLKNLEQALSRYKAKNNIYNLSDQGLKVSDELVELDNNKRDLQNNIESLDSLQKYILTYKEENINIPVPVIVQIADSKIPAEIAELISKSKVREILREGAKDNHPEVIALDNQIKSLKNVLLENIRNLKIRLNSNLKKVTKRLEVNLREQKTLPKKEQGLINFQRNYKISETNYNYLKQKSYEAGTAIAANVSDIKIIDTAKDLNNPSIYPIVSFNYMVAFMLSVILSLFYIIIREVMDNKIYSVEEIMKNYSIPVLGVVGRNNWKNNLVVFEMPKSSVAESFRALRSNIQFLFKADTKLKSKTLVLTSSVSGEGKTMISVNMATAFALSGKKTVLLGLDLRKPKIYDDFDLKNDLGIVNYLIGQKSIEEVTNKTKVPNLDLILSGPIPPNPSELLLSDNAYKMIQYLKENYDYVIIDTPPVGLVSDALGLFKYADAIIYVIRQNYSEKGMMKMIDDKYKNKEVHNISYVLNDFAAQGRYGHGYSYGYGYGKYTNGYHENEEEVTFFSKLIGLIKPKR